ncbi:MAG TPA: ATP synthase F1 subunit gamma [Clostridiales bacterium]|nr:ATP synthase F1 subunit gamma [Clostridiales bacterium]HPP68586.1 ATP synthase F1 subunit gamma [Clostridiales bacterium]
MASLKGIKQRINNVKSVEQLISAMDIIASTKLHKARAQLEGARPIYQGLKRISEEIGYHEEASKHPFYKSSEVKKSLYLVRTSDRGFAGAYNHNITQKVLEHIEAGGKNAEIIAIGQKGYEFFSRRDFNIACKITDVSDARMYHETEDISKFVLNLFLSGKVQEVFVCYTHFENVLKNIPTVEKLLPLPYSPREYYEELRKYEPDLMTYIEHTIPLYIHMSIFRAFSESHTSEQASRMVSMDSASKNAEEMIDKLTYQYNRKRQAAITKELTEIVGSKSLL